VPFIYDRVLMVEGLNLCDCHSQKLVVTTSLLVYNHLSTSLAVIIEFVLVS
jgi:hypothetical protein